MKKKIGFTLAEVLITLGIIGVVAAMTIPTLMANNQKAQYITGLKKAYTAFDQALIQMAADSGCPGNLKCTGLFGTGTTDLALGNSLVSYFKVIKNCTTSTTDQCFSPAVSESISGSAARTNSYNTRAGYRFISADGANYFISDFTFAGVCPSFGPDEMNQACGEIYVDVNGFKGPNNFGRDIFSFYMTNGKGPLLYPKGGSKDNMYGPWTVYWSALPVITNTQGSFATAGKIIEESWEMNY